MARKTQMIGQIRRDLPGLDIEYLHFPEPVSHLLDQLRLKLDGKQPAAVFVSGLENSIDKASESQSKSFVFNFNAARNSFSRIVKCPLVIWLTENALARVFDWAPDFFSI